MGIEEICAWTAVYFKKDGLQVRFIGFLTDPVKEWGLTSHPTLITSVAM